MITLHSDIEELDEEVSDESDAPSSTQRSALARKATLRAGQEREPLKSFSQEGNMLQFIKKRGLSQEDSLGPSAFKKTRVGGGTDVRLSNPDGELWTEKYKPHSVNDLAIHRKKVESVRHWLLEALSLKYKTGKGHGMPFANPVRGSDFPCCLSFKTLSYACMVLFS